MLVFSFSRSLKQARFNINEPLYMFMKIHMRKTMTRFLLIFSIVSLMLIPVHHVIGSVTITNEMKNDITKNIIKTTYKEIFSGLLVHILEKLLLLLLIPYILTVLVAMLVYISVSNMIGPSPDINLFDTPPNMMSISI